MSTVSAREMPVQATAEAMPAQGGGVRPVPQSPSQAAVSSHAVASAAFARYFQDVRARIGLPLEEVARRLSADPRLIHALESGAVAALPAWPEVERVVTLYMRSLRLDAAPALRAIAAAVEHEMASAEALVAVRAAAAAQVAGPAASTPAETAASDGREASASSRDASLLDMARARIGGLVALPRQSLPRVSMRSVVRKGAVLAVMAGVAGGAVLLAQSALSSAGRLPRPAADFMRSANDSVALFFAPKRDGLRWIEVTDPRTRRGDKLQTARR